MVRTQAVLRKRKVFGAVSSTPSKLGMWLLMKSENLVQEWEPESQPAQEAAGKCGGVSHCCAPRPRGTMSRCYGVDAEYRAGVRPCSLPPLPRGPASGLVADGMPVWPCFGDHKGQEKMSQRTKGPGDRGKAWAATILF